jgi:hypothetical protein
MTVTRVFLAAILAFCILSSQASGKSVLIVDGPGGRSTGRSWAFGAFKEALENATYRVDTAGRGEVNADAVRGYDVLILREWSGEMTPTEVSTLYWFLLQRGGGVLVAGGDYRAVDGFAASLGAKYDLFRLGDADDQISGLNDSSSFVVASFEEQNLTRSVRHGVSRFGFYGGRGMSVSGGAICIAAGDNDTVAPAGVFSEGARPCLAAASAAGGFAFIIGESGTFDNRHIGEYDNMRFGLNIIDWLALSGGGNGSEASYRDPASQISEYRLENERLRQDAERLSLERDAAAAGYFEQDRGLQDCRAALLNASCGGAASGPGIGSWAVVVAGALALAGAIVYKTRQL